MEIFDHIQKENTGLPYFEPPRPYSLIRNCSILFGIVLLGIGIASIFTVIIALLNGYDIHEAANVLSGYDDDVNANFIRSVLGTNQFFTFMVPGFLTAYILYKRDWIKNLFLSVSPLTKNWGLGILILLVSAPLVQYSYFLNQLIPLPQYMLDQEEAAKELLSSVMTYSASYEIIFNFLLIAVLPGIGEELIFRGILQKNLEWATKNPHVAVWLSAIIFSTIHFQFAGFIPRILLGAILGYMFYYTQNLWVPIIAHIFNNGVQVLADFFFKEEISSLDIENVESVPWYAGLISLVLVIALIVYLKKINNDRFAWPTL